MSRPTELYPTVGWDKLAEFVETMKASETRANYADEAAGLINRAMASLSANKDWAGLIRLRRLFEFLGRGETLSLGPTLSELNRRAITAAQRIGDHVAAGQFLHDEGHALHRQGRHLEAIQAFDQSVAEYRRVGEAFRARESYYMTSLCHRALGNRRLARQIIEQVLTETGDDPWRANPLIVLSWLVQDEGDLKQAEEIIRQAITILEQSRGPDDVLVGQSLSDLAEIVGFRGQYAEAHDIFQRVLAVFTKHSDQRLTARALLKQAEVYLRANRPDEAMTLLHQAYLAIAEARYYDLMWRIYLAMAQVDLKRKDFAESVRHLRLALKHRRAIGLTDWALVKHYLARQRMGVGLPR